MNSSFVHAAGTQVAVRRHGSGPVVVCTHAIGHGGRDFEALAGRLGHTFEFVMIDWPGQGDSPDWHSGVSSQAYGAILQDVLRTLSLDRVVLLGNSIGGGAAIVTSANARDRVRGLVLCNTAGLVKSTLISRLYCRNKARFFGRAERGVATFPGQFRRLYEKVVLPRPAAQARREEIIASAVKVGPIIRQAWLSFTRPDADLSEMVTSIRCPVLIAWAKDDKVNRWAFSKAAAQRFPNKRVAMLPGGHTAFLESPEEFDRLFVDWMRTLPT